MEHDGEPAYQLDFTGEQLADRLATRVMLQRLVSLVISVASGSPLLSDGAKPTPEALQKALFELLHADVDQSEVINASPERAAAIKDRARDIVDSVVTGVRTG